jgi:hypothetical protein
MPEDFEKSWLAKFSRSLDRVVGTAMRDEIMEGYELLSDNADREVVMQWSQRAMTRLEERSDSSSCIEAMTGCSCQYPKDDLQEMRRRFEETGDIDLVLGLLQEKFVSFLKNGLNLSGEIITDIVGRGWGLAGRRDGNRIIATKIPKSIHIMDYFEEADPVKKRAIYCHCPRIRGSLKTDVHISPTYCYCGAGYYKGIWEEILQRPVKVELLESVLKGDDICKFAVHLPGGDSRGTGK